MHETTETELLSRYRRGDTRAFAELVRRHQGPLLRHARSLVGPRGASEDVVQEAFLKLAQDPPELESADTARTQLSSWLHKVTRNLCMDVIRSETRRKHREHDVAAREASEGGLAAIEAADTRAVVEKKLGGLPQDQREVLVLRLLGEKSYREIAEITGKKVGTVGWLVSLGLKSLASDLAPLFSKATKTNERAALEPGMGLGWIEGKLS